MPNPEDGGGEGAKDASPWPSAGVPDPDVVRQDSGDHHAQPGVVVVKEALGVDLHNVPDLLEGSLDALWVPVFARELDHREGHQPGLVEDEAIGRLLRE